MENEPFLLLLVSSSLILCDSRLPPIPKNFSSSLPTLSIPIFPPISQKTELLEPRLMRSSPILGTNGHRKGKRMIGSKGRTVSRKKNLGKTSVGRAEHESDFGPGSSSHLLFLREREDLDNWELPMEFLFASSPKGILAKKNSAPKQRRGVSVESPAALSGKVRFPP